MSSENSVIINNSISKNTFYNFLGFSLPLFFAIFLIPIIINKLGTERFGLLSLVWVLIGYFSFFDLGIGRALTKIISEKIGLKKTNEIPTLFWTSFIITFLISSLFSIILYFFSNDLINRFLKISSELKIEAILSFYLLLLILPFVATTAALRGILESYQRFDIINIIRLFLGITNFLIPAIVIQFKNDLFYVVAYLVIFRIIVWIMFFVGALKVDKQLKNFSIKISFIKPIFKLSSWMTISNLTIPIMVYLDRILIGAMISAEAIAYYATPYEVVTKLWIIPTAITGVLFPNFSMNYVVDKNYTVSLLKKSTKYVTLFLLPIILILILFSDYILTVWLGKDFSEKSFVVMRFILLGVFFNCIAQILFSFIEGIGKPDVTAKLQLIELPLYIVLMYYFTKNYSIVGASLVFMLRMLIDFILLSAIVKNITRIKFSTRFNFKQYVLSATILVSFALILIEDFLIKILLSLIIFTFLIFLIWYYFIEFEDKKKLWTLLKVLLLMKKEEVL
ncbi:MAG: flippase [Ignavibacterium sp.]|nr:flippase [Ignavibacterium sp.]MDW8374638.1 flippase [Ignavibacteriales bacterium]